MLGWLGRKNQDARVFMCIKEIKMVLDAEKPVGRAKILAMAQLLRLSIFHEAGIEGAIDRPLDYSRDELMKLYSGLETVRNNSVVQMNALKKNMQNFGMELPDFSVEHAKITSRGLEVWMCTLGAGIAPNRRDDVRSIWMMLSGSLRDAPEAIANIRAVEQQTSDMTGSGQMFALSDDEWLELCRYIPSQLSARQLLSA